MKKLILTIGFMFLFSTTVFSQNTIKKTNLDSVIIKDWQIEYSSGNIEQIKDLKSYRGLFINGSIVESPDIIVENDYILVPLRVVSEELGAEVTWNGENETVTILDGDTILELTIGSRMITGNKKFDSMKVPPKKFNGLTYVPLRFVASALGGKVDYFDGYSEKNTGLSDEEITDLHILPRMSYVIISKYDVDEEFISKSEAIEILRKELITAYEFRFKKEFVPLENYEIAENEMIDDEIILRSIFTDGLQVREERDRFYVVPVVFDFWVDKYTGDIFVFYNGQQMSILKFNPNSEYAIMFVG